MSGAMEYCTFRVGPLLLGVEVARVQEVIRTRQITRVPLAAPGVSGLINLRGQIVTAIDLRQRFGLAADPRPAPPMHVVSHTRAGAVSFLVDRICDVTTAPEEAREAVPATLDQGIRALLQCVVKLEGELLLVLDAEQAAMVAENSVDGGRAETPRAIERCMP